MNRRAFWKFAAAAPVAAIASVVGARVTPKPEIPAAAITIEGASVTLHNLNLEGSITIKPGSEAAIYGAYIKQA